jgi:hypothetical protein
VIAPPEGMKPMVLGGTLVGLGAVTALLSTAPGFELDMFDVAICVAGACLLLHGAMQARRARRRARR